MDDERSELSLGYWQFEDQETALAFLDQLAKGCTAHSVLIYLTDSKGQFIKGYQMGDEYKQSQELTSLPQTS